MNTLEQILSFLQGSAATLTAVFPAGTTSEEIARYSALLADVARAAVHAHNQVNPTEALDITRLHEIPQVG